MEAYSGSTFQAPRGFIAYLRDVRPHWFKTLDSNGHGRWTFYGWTSEHDMLRHYIAGWRAAAQAEKEG